MATMIPDARRLVLASLFALSWCLPRADADTISAYTYTHAGVDGVPSLASKVPAGVGDVFLKAIDIAPDGSVLPKISGGNFYPAAWPTGSPSPQFTAMINADPTTDWTTANPATALTTALTSNNWTQDYNAGITVDAEFATEIQTFPQNWVTAMTDLRSLANGAGQGFSLYLSPKYLDAARYPNAATNATTLAGILGTAPSGVANAVLFPTYADNASNIDAATLNAATTAVAGHSLTHRWIYNLSQSESVFAEAMQRASAADSQASSAADGPVVYAYEDNQAVTATMTANFNTLSVTLAVPEPATTALLVSASLGIAMFRLLPSIRRRGHRVS